MASKTYTAQEMRDVAQCLHYNSPTKLTIEAAAMLRQSAEALEREARRKMKYEYIERYKNGCLSASVSRTLVVARACMSQFSTILRREVGEWEEVPE